MNRDGRYIYGIINTGQSQKFGPLGIGGRLDMVYTLGFRDIAAVVSHSPILKYPVTRENSIAHQKVLEKVMKKHIVLPVRFCTIAEEEEAIEEKVLKARYEEFKNLFFKMRDKIELGVRAFWPNVEGIFEEIVKENKEIKRLKEEVLKSKSRGRIHAGRMKIGELVQKALIRNKRGFAPVVKILSNGILTKKISVSSCLFSNSAKEKIEKAGGEIK